jgi:L-malate glycosyltransferase
MTPASVEFQADRLALPASRPRTWLRGFWQRQTMLASLVLIKAAGWIGRRRRPMAADGCRILLTGAFNSENWILAHLQPLAEARRCSHVWMVSSTPVPKVPKVEAVYPPSWLTKAVGRTPARLLTFGHTALARRPDVVGGFHLLFNGIAAAVVGRLAGARCLYICVGGTEVANDGICDEPNCFSRRGTPDRVTALRRLRIVASFDRIVTMGTRAGRFFRDSGIGVDFHVIPGGIDARRFHMASVPGAGVDVVLTARLALEKRIDVFLQTVRHVADRLPRVRAVVVGDGELRPALERMASDLGIEGNVHFAGSHGDVEQWLRRAKVFVLTSDLEGLPLSAMEAMMCGLPAVVSDVGDLGDLVEDGTSGYRVPRRSPQQLAERIVELLSDEPRRRGFSEAARRSALRYSIEASGERWDGLIASLAGS